MEQHAWTLEETRAICREHHALQGTSIIRGDRLRIVEAVVPAPADELNQWLFFSFYLECRNKEKALDFYRGNGFRPMVVLRELSSDGHVEYNYATLEGYLEQYGKFPETALTGTL